MRVLIVRHAKAEDRERFAATGQSDDWRPLTGAGQTHARMAGRVLKELLPRIDALATSPWVRARDTARLLAKAYPRLAPTELPTLAPGSSMPAVLGWLQNQPPEAVVGLVGHEPELSQLATWLLTGRARSSGPVLEFKKGAACLIEFADRPMPGRGVLVWLLAPGQLRRLAD